jgi:hypothetical protein
MSDFFEIDANGIRSDFKWSENDQEFTIHRTVDVEPVLDAAKAGREGGLNRADIARGWWHYASLPPIVILQMKAKGIDVYDKNDQARMLAEINTHYPHLKMTTGKMGGKTKIHG